MKTNPALAPLDRALGRWKVTGSHPYLEGRALRGEVTFERIEEGAFVRGVSRTYEVTMKKEGGEFEPDLRLSYAR